MQEINQSMERVIMFLNVALIFILHTHLCVMENRIALEMLPLIKWHVNAIQWGTTPVNVKNPLKHKCVLTFTLKVGMVFANSMTSHLQLANIQSYPIIIFPMKNHFLLMKKLIPVNGEKNTKGSFHVNQQILQTTLCMKCQTHVPTS